MKRAIKEAQYIAQKKNIEVEEINFVTLTYDVARKTADNRNSMLQDIQRGNPTEIDFINGKIVSYAKELGLDVPVNETLTYLIKGFEFSNQKKKAELKN
jgi:2-dehydropantoate 2-reductase